MIAKVPPKRKKSNVKKLINYITIRENLHPDSKDSEIIFSNEHRTVINFHGVICEHNGLSLETLKMEMEATSKHNPKVKDSTYHFILSWSPNENPTDEQALECARYALKNLGLQGHQYISAIHHDTDHKHIHVVVNRIHPTTYKCISVFRDYFTLDRTMRELEIKFGWNHSNGAYQVSEINNEKIIHLSSVKKSFSDKIPSRIKCKEIYNDEESLLIFARNEPKKEFLKLLKNKNSTWQHLHKMFANYNLEIVEKGAGLAIVDKSTQIGIKASSVHEKLSKKRLTQWLGDFMPYTFSEEKNSVVQSYHPFKSVRDKNIRESQRIKRAVEREKLKQRYRQYRANFHAQEHINYDYYHSLFKRLSQKMKQRRIRIWQNVQDLDLRKAMYSLLVLERAKERLRIKILFEEEKAKIKANPLNRKMNYQEWVYQQAEQGDKTAVSQLRGWHYAELKKNNNNKKTVS